MPALSLFKPVVYDADAVTYFNKVGTPLSDLSKAQVNTLILTMKELGIWSTCAHGWLYLPEHSGVPAGATTGVFYDLKGVSDLTMTGFAAAGQTQTSNGPHIWQNGAKTLSSTLSGTVPTIGFFGDTNYANGEDIGSVWCGLWDPWIDFSSNTGSGAANGSTPFMFGVGTTPTSSSDGAILSIGPGGSGNQTTPCAQYFSRRFPNTNLGTKGLRYGQISNIMNYYDPVLSIFDPTASTTWTAMGQTNERSANLTGNTVGVYNYVAHESIGRAYDGNVPDDRAFELNHYAWLVETGKRSFSRPPYQISSAIGNGFVIDSGVPTTISTNVITCRANKSNTTNVAESTGSYPFYFFLFSKNTNFGFRKADKMKTFTRLLADEIGGPTRNVPALNGCLDRATCRQTINLTDPTLPPPKIYFGSNNFISLHCNDILTATNPTNFTLDLYVEQGEYNTMSSALKTFSSANLSTFLTSLQYRMHDGATRNVTSPFTLTFPTTFTSFTVNPATTITRDIGFGSITYVKIAAVTATSAAIVRRMYQTFLTTLNGQEVVVCDFAITYATTYDTDAAAYFTTASVTDLATKDRINNWVVGMKALGLWTGLVSWPMRTGQNAGSGTTIYSLGGLGSYPGTLVNSPTFEPLGLKFAASGSKMTTTLAVAASPVACFMVGKTYQPGSNNSGVFYSGGVNVSGRQFSVSNSAATTAQNYGLNANTWQTNAIPTTGVNTASPALTGTRTDLTYNSWRVISATEARLTRGWSQSSSAITVTGWDTSSPTSVAFGLVPEYTAELEVSAFWYISGTAVTNALDASVYALYKNTLGLGLGLP